MSQQDILDVVPIDGEGEAMSSAAIKKVIGLTGNVSYQFKALIEARELVVKRVNGQPRYLRPGKGTYDVPRSEMPMRDPKTGRYSPGHPPSNRNLMVHYEDDISRIGNRRWLKINKKI